MPICMLKFFNMTKLKIKLFCYSSLYLFFAVLQAYDKILAISYSFLLIVLKIECPVKKIFIFQQRAFKIFVLTF